VAKTGKIDQKISGSRLTHDLIWRKSRGLVGEVLVNKKTKKGKKNTMI